MKTKQEDTHRFNSPLKEKSIESSTTLLVDGKFISDQEISRHTVGLGPIRLAFASL
jgi:hypothetical protein